MNDAGKILVAALDAALAPPTQNNNKTMKFQRCREALARIHELEKKLGLPQGGTIYRIIDANRRVAELETMLALTEKSSSGAAVNRVFAKNLPDASPVAAHAAPVLLSPPKATHPDRSLMLEAVESVFPLESIAALERKTVANLWLHLEKLCFQSHCRIAGMKPDAELAEIYFRSEKPTGIARTMKADRQQKLDKLFKTNL